mmetsp:Transcript_36199/g.65688  ORF Transcript_36199/g.65688 Transcript_36199/m.65688 type:complete len:372 (-) Transcript_36199:96-1211(-)
MMSMLMKTASFIVFWLGVVTIARAAWLAMFEGLVLAVEALLALVHGVVLVAWLAVFEGLILAVMFLLDLVHSVVTITWLAMLTCLCAITIRLVILLQLIAFWSLQMPIKSAFKRRLLGLLIAFAFLHLHHDDLDLGFLGGFLGLLMAFTFLHLHHEDLDHVFHAHGLHCLSKSRGQCFWPHILHLGHQSLGINVRSEKKAVVHLHRRFSQAAPMPRKLCFHFRNRINSNRVRLNTRHLCDGERQCLGGPGVDEETLSILDRQHQVAVEDELNRLLGLLPCEEASPGRILTRLSTQGQCHRNTCCQQSKCDKGASYDLLDMLTASALCWLSLCSFFLLDKHVILHYHADNNLVVDRVISHLHSQHNGIVNHL